MKRTIEEHAARFDRKATDYDRDISEGMLDRAREKAAERGLANVAFARGSFREPNYDPEVDDPATVGVLADALTDAGFALTAVETVHEQVGVLVGERER